MFTSSAAWAQAPIQGAPADGRLDYGAVSANAEDADAQTGAPVSAILPKVRLTPRDLELPGVDAGRLSLNGDWKFVFDVPDSFDGTAAGVEGWDTVRVPGHYHLQGHPRMHKEMGVPVAWAKSFDVPASWRGRRVVLRFEGVDGLNRLWVNGNPAGETDIATLPSEYDITRFVEFGQTNELVMTVERSLVTRWSRRELGSITRDAWLWSLPAVNLARLHVATDLKDDGSSTLYAHVRVANQSDAPVSSASLAFSLGDAAGAAVALEPDTSELVLPVIAPGQTLELKFPLHVPADAGVETWTAETPNLYVLRGELRRDGEALMAARQRFGFREVEVRGHAMLVNGSPIRMRGTNYHITYPNMHETLPERLIRRDLELFRAANFNTLRSRPTPDIAYVDLCDELGMYTTVEAMISLMMYDKGPDGSHGADPSIAPGFRLHLATMVENYYSNPSVLTWGLGNECPYYDYFKIGALGLQARDPGRPIFFGSDARLGVGIPFVDINDDHYPRGKHGMDPYYGTGSVDDPASLDGQGWDYPTDRPIFFTEWLHVHVNNGLEIAYDPGVDDFWGYAAETHLEVMYDRPHFLGGFHFKGAPYRGIGNNDHWRALFEANRRKNDTFWHTQKSHSPVRILDTVGERTADGGLTVEVENRFDFLDLAELTLAWARGEESGELDASVPPHQTGSLSFPAPLDPSSAASPVRLEVRDPDGQVIDRYVLGKSHEAPERFVDATAEAWKVREGDDATFVLSRGDAQIAIGREDGRILAARVDGEPVISDAVDLLILPAELRNFRRQRERALVNQATNWQAEDVAVDRRGDTVVVRAIGKYDQAEGGFETTFHADGRVTVAYDFRWTGPSQINLLSTGVRVPVAETLDTLTWSRDAQWSVYPEHHIGRPVGVAPALGDPTFRSTRDGYETVSLDGLPGVEAIEPWPWSQDLISGVTRDFRSTKFFVFEAGLVDAAQNVGVAVLSDAEHHVQAVPAHDNLGGKLNHEAPAMDADKPTAWHLHVLDFHNGGTEPHLTKSLRYGQKITDEDTRFVGEATLVLTPPAVHLP
ncbi:MAG: glycoside hydrolase family 2 TIM barrel-domain containing protein [Planctomycetota bacterium]